MVSLSELINYWEKIELIKNDMDHKKDPTVLSVVKATLILIYGNSVVE